MIKDLTISPNSNSEECIFFSWPIELLHVVDRTSPFFDMSAAQLMKENFELILSIDGTNETSNLEFQAR